MRGNGRRRSERAAERATGARRKKARQAGAARRSAAAPQAPEHAESPFERFVLGYVTARGGSVEPLGRGDYQATFDPALARRVRRQGARLIFDANRALLPRGGVFVAPASRFGLVLIEGARASGHVTRERVDPAATVDVDALAGRGFVVHGARLRSWQKGEPRWVAEILFHLTVTVKGGGAEQDLRAVLADSRGPTFEFVEAEERRAWRLLPGFPEGPVWWGEYDAGRGLPQEETVRVWSALVAWMNRVLEPRLVRWRRRCQEGRDRDLARVNAYYETRLAEEEERRRRRAEAQEDEDQATEAEIKLEWERRVRSVRANWEATAEMRLWGIEEIARPRVPVTWMLATPGGTHALAGDIDLTEGAVARMPCPLCRRLVGEFWWEGGFVCRRCRGKGGGQRRESGDEAPPGGRGARAAPRAGGRGGAPSGRDSRSRARKR